MVSTTTFDVTYSKGEHIDPCNASPRPSSRSRHVFKHLEALLLCQQTQLTYKPNMGLRKKTRVSPEPTSDQASLNQSCTTLRDVSYQYINPSQSHLKLRHEDPPKLATPALLTTR